VEARLRPINAVLALLMSGDVRPVLADAGFRLIGLEIPVGLAEERVVIDILAHHESTGHLLALEAKSGPNIDEVQARKYAALDPQLVVDAQAITLRTRATSVEAVFVCNAEHAARVEFGLTQASVRVPILAVGPGQVTLFDPTIASRSLADALNQPAVLAYGVPRIIAFDADSPVDVIRPSVHACLVTHLSRRSTQVTVASLAEEVAPHLSFYGRGARERFKRMVADAVRGIADADPETFAFRGATGTHEAVVQFLRTPEANDPRGRTQAYQALARGRHSNARTRQVSDPNQLDLLDALDEDDEEDSERPMLAEAWTTADNDPNSLASDRNQREVYE